MNKNFRPFHRLTSTEVSNDYLLNGLTPILLNNAVLKSMIRRNKGRIITGYIFFLFYFLKLILKQKWIVGSLSGLILCPFGTAVKFYSHL